MHDLESSFVRSESPKIAVDRFLRVSEKHHIVCPARSRWVELEEEQEDGAALVLFFVDGSILHGAEDLALYESTLQWFVHVSRREFLSTSA